MLMFTFQRSTQIIHCRAWATCDLSVGWFLHTPLAEPFFYLLDFGVHTQERLCMNRVRSLLSMRCMLPGYSFEPRPNMPNRRVLASNFNAAFQGEPFTRINLIIFQGSESSTLLAEPFFCLLDFGVREKDSA